MWLANIDEHARVPRLSQLLQHFAEFGDGVTVVLDRTTTYKGSKTGIPGIIDSQRDVGGYPDLKGGEAPVDSDHDGMADEWEKAHNLNPNDPSDGAKDSVGDGYTNLERYLNSIVAK